MNNDKHFWRNFDIEWKELIEHQLLKESYIVDLLLLYSIYSDEYNFKNSTIEERNSEENRDKFFNYLLPLIEGGELKVKVRDQEGGEIPNPSYDKSRSEDPDYLIAKVSYDYKFVNEREYGKGQGKEVVEDIRKRWRKYVDDMDRSNWESWGCIFTLPENEWPPV